MGGRRAASLGSMVTSEQTDPQDVHQFSLRVVGGFRLSRAVWLAARLRLADHVGPGPATVADLARACAADAASLERVLNALAAAGVFRRDEHGRVEQTPASELLRSDHPRSQRAWLDVVLGGEIFEAWGALEEAVITGRPAFDIRHGAPCFDYYRAHPVAGREFAEAMTSTTRAFEDAILDAEPFGPFELAVDVGGSQGSLLRRLLERQSDARGVVFDLPEVVAGWPAEAPLGGRLRAVAGDFFQTVPDGGDLYLLKFVLHDWGDDHARVILRRVREAVRRDGRVAIVEMVLPESPTAHPGWLMDLNMLALTTGRERTAPDFTAMLDETGWRLHRIVATASPMSVLVATPA
jgi:hypothetical protein